MKYIEAPNYDKITDDQSLFLAGGITGVQDWQAYAIEKFKVLDNITVLNPRRVNFEAFKNDSSFKESESQIHWEKSYISYATQVMFWFSNETIQPIALFELGVRLGLRIETSETGNQELFIGIHPEYARRLDLFVQLPLHGYRVENIYSNLDKLIDRVIVYNKNLKHYKRDAFYV